VIRRGQARDGIAYGPLTDLPDWSFAGKKDDPWITVFYNILILFFTKAIDHKFLWVIG